MTARQYHSPTSWIAYDSAAVQPLLIEAKATLLALQAVPYQRGWVDHFQDVQLKREVEGTSRIEGAEFGEGDLEAALANESAEEKLNRSQRQARAAAKTYRWFSELDPHQPLTLEFVLKVHRLLVTDADDDHCEPGRLRKADNNVTFGQPRHRGAEGGTECQTAITELVNAAETTFLSHDVLVQAIALHYHLAAIHPFGDGNGRTARAIEAWILRKVELRGGTFIALSNYYYDHKTEYLAALAATYESRGDLTDFIKFGLRAVVSQSQLLLQELRRAMQKELFRNLMYDLYKRLRSPRKRVMAKRQVEILKIMLQREEIDLVELMALTAIEYKDLKDPVDAFVRDLVQLRNLGAIELPNGKVKLRLDWPERMTGSKEFEEILSLPVAQSDPVLRSNLRRWIGQGR